MSPDRGGCLCHARWFFLLLKTFQKGIEQRSYHLLRGLAAGQVHAVADLECANAVHAGPQDARDLLNLEFAAMFRHGFEGALDHAENCVEFGEIPIG